MKQAKRSTRPASAANKHKKATATADARASARQKYVQTLREAETQQAKQWMTSRMKDLDEQLNILANSHVFQGLQVHGKHVSRFSEMFNGTDRAGTLSGTSGWEDFDPIQERIKRAQRSKRLTPAELKEILLPAAVVGSNEVLLPVREVCDVLEIDLDVQTSEADERELLRAYGRDGQVDVRAMLSDMALWPVENPKALTLVPPAPPRPTTPKVAWASDADTLTVAPSNFVRTAPARAQNLNGTESADSWSLYHTTAVDHLSTAPLESSKHTNPTRAEQMLSGPAQTPEATRQMQPTATAVQLQVTPSFGSQKMPSSTPREERVVSGTSMPGHARETPFAIPDVRSQSHESEAVPELKRAASVPLEPATTAAATTTATTAATTKTGSSQVQEGSENAPRDSKVSLSATSQASLDSEDLVQQLKVENARLKRELMSFDLNFFEELEDLKFENQRLKQATKQHPPTSPIMSSFNWHMSDLPSTLPSRVPPMQLDAPEAVWQAPGAYPALSSSHYNDQAYAQPPFRSVSPVVRPQPSRIAGTQPLPDAAFQSAVERRLAFELQSTPNSAQILLNYLKQCAEYNPYMTHTQLLDALRHSGISFSDSEAWQLAAGFATNGNGLVDVQEVADTVRELANTQTRELEQYDRGDLMLSGGQSPQPAALAWVQQLARVIRDLLPEGSLDMHTLEAQFRQHDLTASGHVSIEELPLLLIRLGTSVSYSELRERIHSVAPTNQRLVNWFQLLDTIASSAGSSAPRTGLAKNVQARLSEPTWATKAWRVAEKMVMTLCEVPNFQPSLWLQSFEASLRAASTYGISGDEDDVVGQAEFWRCLKTAGVDLSLPDREQLWRHIGVEHASTGSVGMWASRSLPRLCRYSEITRWFRNQIQHHPWLLQNPAKLTPILWKFVEVMGTTLKKRRRFVATLRRRFADVATRMSQATADNAQCITPGAFLSVLKDTGVNLSVAEEAALLDVMESCRNSGSDALAASTTARMFYPIMLDICSKFCGNWQTSYPELIESLRTTLEETVRPQDTVLALQRCLEGFDDAQQGSVTRRSLLIALAQCKLALPEHQSHLLCDVLDLHSTGHIAYQPLLEVLGEIANDLGSSMLSHQHPDVFALMKQISRGFATGGHGFLRLRMSMAALRTQQHAWGIDRLAELLAPSGVPLTTVEYTRIHDVFCGDPSGGDLSSALSNLFTTLHTSARLRDYSGPAAAIATSLVRHVGTSAGLETLKRRFTLCDSLGTGLLPTDVCIDIMQAQAIPVNEQTILLLADAFDHTLRYPPRVRYVDLIAELVQAAHREASETSLGTADKSTTLKVVPAAFWTAARRHRQTADEWKANVQTLFEGFDHLKLGTVSRETCIRIFSLLEVQMSKEQQAAVLDLMAETIRSAEQGRDGVEPEKRLMRYRILLDLLSDSGKSVTGVSGAVNPDIPSATSATASGEVNKIFARLRRHCRTSKRDAFVILARTLGRIGASSGASKIGAQELESELSAWAKSQRLPLQLPDIRAIVKHYAAEDGTVPTTVLLEEMKGDRIASNNGGGSNQRPFASKQRQHPRR